MILRKNKDRFDPRDEKKDLWVVDELFGSSDSMHDRFEKELAGKNVTLSLQLVKMTIKLFSHFHNHRSFHRRSMEFAHRVHRR